MSCIPVYDSTPIFPAPIKVTALPATCAVGNIVSLTAAAPTVGLYFCYPQDTWTIVGTGSGGSAVGPVNSIQASDGAGGFQVTGCLASSGAITCTSSGGVAGAFSFPQGTANTISANSVGFQAPASVSSAFYFTLPAAPAAGYLHATNATPSVLIAQSIPAADLPAVPTSSGGNTSLTGPRQYYYCTGTCTIIVPVPVAGYQFCVGNDDNITSVITLAALGSSARYESQSRTSYGTAGTGTLVMNGAAANMVCIVGLDSTHYQTIYVNGTATTN